MDKFTSACFSEGGNTLDEELNHESVMQVSVKYGEVKTEIDFNYTRDSTPRQN